MKVALQALTKKFDRVTAVDRVSLAVAEGECFFLLGPSGCGKTTLLRMIAGFCAPDAGDILFNGRRVNDLPPHRRNTGMVFQNYALWPHMSVAENVAFGLTVPERMPPAAERRERVGRLLKAVHMEDYAERRPNQLSGGQQQRVALARALVIEPDCLLLDEPLSNLDAKLRLEMRVEIKRIVKSMGITTIYVTHDQKEALSMADRCAILREGRVEQVGAPGELYLRPASRFVADFIGGANLIPGTVQAGAGGATRVATGCGEWVGQPSAGSFKTGAPVLLCVRPESIRFNTSAGLSAGLPSGALAQEGGPAQAGAPNVFTGTINESMYYGDQTEHWIAMADGTLIKALTFGAGRIAAPPPVATSFQVDPAAVTILPAG